MDSILLFLQQYREYAWLGGGFLLLLLIFLLALGHKRRKAKAQGEGGQMLGHLQAASAWQQNLEEELRLHGYGSLRELAVLFPALAPEIQGQVQRIVQEELWLSRALHGAGQSFSPEEWAGLWQVFGDTRLFPQLIEFLAAKDEEMRLWGVQIIASIGDQRIIPYLIGALLQPQIYLPARVGEALAAYGPESARLLARMLPGLKPQDKLLALPVLGQFGPVYPHEGLSAALEDEDGEIRAAAAAALGDSRQLKAAPHLLAVSADAHWEVRSAAAKALGQLREARAVPRLKELLRDEDFRVRANAEEALGRISPKRSQEQTQA